MRVFVFHLMPWPYLPPDFSETHDTAWVVCENDLYDPERGWYSGLYEATQTPNKAMTANTNAIILESLYYRRFGKLMQPAYGESSEVRAAN